MASSSTSAPLFHVLESIFGPVQRAKRHLREGRLQKRGRDCRGSLKKASAGRRRRFVDAEAGVASSSRPISEEAVHLMWPAVFGRAQEAWDTCCEWPQEDRSEVEVAASTGIDGFPTSEKEPATGSMGLRLQVEAPQWQPLPKEGESPPSASALETGIGCASYGLKEGLEKSAPCFDNREASEQIVFRDQLKLFLQEGRDRLLELELFSAAWEAELVRQKDQVEGSAKKLSRLEDHWSNRLSNNAAEDNSIWEDWEDVLQTFVKESILQSCSEYEIMQRAELLIDEDWLGTIDDLPGNIYRMAAFGEFNSANTPMARTRKISEDSSGQLPKRGRSRKAVASSRMAFATRRAGFIAIVIIQMIGPPLICGSALPKPLVIGVVNERRYRWEVLRDSPWLDQLIEEWQMNWMTKLLGVLFMSAFILNGAYVAYQELCAFRRISGIFRYLNRSTAHVRLQGSTWLLVGLLVNNWVLFWCSLDAFFIAGAAQTPLDVLLDALGVVFVYKLCAVNVSSFAAQSNLDDVKGDLAFVDGDDWDGARLGWISAEMVDANYEPLQKEDDPLIQEGDTQCEDSAKDVFVSYWGERLYIANVFVTGTFAFALPILACLIPFSMVAPED